MGSTSIRKYILWQYGVFALLFHIVRKLYIVRDMLLVFLDWNRLFAALWGKEALVIGGVDKILRDAVMAHPVIEAWQLE
jgi:hypothetical protein